MVWVLSVIDSWNVIEKSIVFGEGVGDTGSGERADAVVGRAPSVRHQAAGEKHQPTTARQRPQATAAHTAQAVSCERDFSSLRA